MQLNWSGCEDVEETKAQDWYNFESIGSLSMRVQGESDSKGVLVETEGASGLVQERYAKVESREAK